MDRALNIPPCGHYAGRLSAAVRRLAIGVTALSLSVSHALAAEQWKRSDSPFMLGEAYPEIAATCETAKYWIKHAPEIDARVSFAIKGKLVAVEWDGALAYLLMCDESDVQVLCVTYSRDGRNVGDTVVFGGGYSRAGDRRIMLDPCLAGPAD